MSNFTKRETFPFFMTPKCSLGFSPNVALLLAPSKKDLPFSFCFAKRRLYLNTQLEVDLADLFSNLPGCVIFPQAE